MLLELKIPEFRGQKFNVWGPQCKIRRRREADTAHSGDQSEKRPERCRRAGQGNPVVSGYSTVRQHSSEEATK